MIYGLSEDSLARSTEDVLPLYLDESIHWQCLSQVVPGRPITTVCLYYTSSSMMVFIGGIMLPYHQAKCSMFQQIVPLTKQRSIKSMVQTSSNIDEAALAQHVVYLIIPSLHSIFEWAD